MIDKMSVGVYLTGNLMSVNLTLTMSQSGTVTST